MSLVADRARISSSATMQVLDLIKEHNRTAQQVISLSAGEPDFVTPEHIREYAKRALDEGYTFCPDAAGIPELREAIAEKLQHENGIEAKLDISMVVVC